MRQRANPTPDVGCTINGQSIKFDIQAVRRRQPDRSPGRGWRSTSATRPAPIRNNFLVVENTANGLRIAVSEPTADGQDFTGDETDLAPNDWRELVSGVNASTSHTIEMRLDYVDGQNNDVIGVYLDGQLIGETTTFENYHDGLNGAANHIANAIANETDRVIFRESNNGQPEDGASFGRQQQGFYIDNLTTSVYNNTSGTGNTLDNVITGNSGDNLLTGLEGNDTINGGAGIDTSVYRNALANYTVTTTTDGHGRVTGFSSVTQNTVLPQNDGSDTLTSIEHLQFSDVTLDVTKNVQLFDHSGKLIGTFDSIQAAVNAGADGDKIVLAAGTYAEDVTLDKNIEIDGANSGACGHGYAWRGEHHPRPDDGDGGGILRALKVAINGVEITTTPRTTTHSFSLASTTSPRGRTSRSPTACSMGSSTGGKHQATSLLIAPSSCTTGCDQARSTSTTICSRGPRTRRSRPRPGPPASGRTARRPVRLDDRPTTPSSSCPDRHQRRQLQRRPGDRQAARSSISGTGVSIGVGYHACHEHHLNPRQLVQHGRYRLQPAERHHSDQLRPDGDQQHHVRHFVGHGAGRHERRRHQGQSASDILVGNAGNDTLTGGGGNNALSGGAGIDTAAGYAAGATIAIQSGHWVVNHDGKTDVLTGIEKVVISTTTYMLVDQTGANGGFQHVQDAIDAAPAGSTILIAPGTYSESHTTASGAAGIYINTASLTLQGVDANGAPITSAAVAQASGPTIISAHENDFGANDWIDTGGTNTVIAGVHLQAGPETDNKLLEVWANNVTIQNDFIDVNANPATYTAGGGNGLFVPPIPAIPVSRSISTTTEIRRPTTSPATPSTTTSSMKVCWRPTASAIRESGCQQRAADHQQRVHWNVRSGYRFGTLRHRCHQRPGQWHRLVA